VSSLNEQIKSILETTFSTVYLEGEISNITYHNSGHIYFTIKDNKSVLSCVMFKGNAQYLKFRLEIGQKINIRGNITVYTPRGNYQLLAQKIEPSGVGELLLAYEQLKTKLQIKGYFDKSLKKELPLYPNNIYVITSNTGAAIEDMKKILKIRYPLAKMILIPSLVQGEEAKYSIVKALKIAEDLAIKDKKNKLKPIIILGRGGGSIEDLWAFNEEIVADTIFNLTTPVISAVGHENDFVISDFVADIRASTPSNAIEISTPNINDLKQFTDSIEIEFSNKLKYIINKKEENLRYLQNSFEQHSLKKKFQFISNSIYQLKKQYNHILNQKIIIKQNMLNNIKDSYELNKPSNKDKYGYVQLTKNNKISSLDKININDNISLENSNIIVSCKVISKNIIDKI
ncbi:MAG: exodeoxyribonuclease VII large subunit, partial [Campylobacterota bacterium]|nr:exodeoxyribonuclease VII large subunit [Campylobacterota bacterium]